jgi:HK97 family phage prohead protease
MTEDLQKNAVSIDNDFDLTMTIAKAYEETREEGDNVRYVSGRASGINLDRDGERMAPTAIQAFKKAIDEGIIAFNGEKSEVPLRSGHRDEWDDILGWIVSAEIDKSSDLWITAELEPTSRANDLYKALTTPRKAGRPNELGFSVGGKIKKASRQWDAELQRSVITFDDVALKEVSVVGKPSYPTAYVEALMKSVRWEEVPTEEQSMTEQEVVEETITQTEVTKNETDNATEGVVTEQEASVDATLVSALSDSVAAIQTQVESLTKAVEALVVANDLNKSTTESLNEEVETDVQEERVEEVNVQESISKAVTDALGDAFKTFTDTVIAPITEKLNATTEALTHLAEMPLDKSLSVITDKEDENDPYTRFAKKFGGSTRQELASSNFLGEIVRMAATHQGS